MVDRGWSDGSATCSITCSTVWGSACFANSWMNWSTFDYRFRLIAGRRNIYAWMLCSGFWAGLPVQTLVAALSWALITLGVHAMRLVYHVRQRLAMAESLSA